MATLQQAFLTKEELEIIPKELRLISLDYALERATFTREEIIWLFDLADTVELETFSIFYSNGKEAKLFKYKQNLYHKNELKQFGWMQLRHYPKLYYNVGLSHFSMEKQILYDKLIGRLDTNTVRIQPDEMMNNREFSQANIVLTDIRAIFLILCHRYKPINKLKFKELAVNATKEILNNIVNYYGLHITDDESKLPALLIYLVTSAEIFGLVKKNEVDKYIVKGKERESCHTLYKMINESLDALLI